MSSYLVDLGMVLWLAVTVLVGLSGWVVLDRAFELYSVRGGLVAAGVVMMVASGALVVGWIHVSDVVWP